MAMFPKTAFSSENLIIKDRHPHLYLLIAPQLAGKLPAENQNFCLL